MSPGPPDETSELLTFLFADIRGYTTFTQQHGDEAAAKLTAKFAWIVRDLVAQHGGTVFELRGDEALCVFRSPRQSLRLGVALQQRFVEETAADCTLPMTVGIGVDVGEAERGPDGYRGGVLNLAARLCAQAKAGEVLASSEVTHLARTIAGLRYFPLDHVVLKGLSEPVRPIRVLPEGEDPARQLVALRGPPPIATTRAVRWLPGPLGRRPRMTSAAALVVIAAAGVLPFAVDRGHHSHALSTGLKSLAENSVGIVDPRTGSIIGQVAVGAGPTALATGFGSIWTTNPDADTVSRIDIATRRVVDTIEVGEAPAAIAVGPDSVWVVNSGGGSVSRIDPTTDNQRPIRVGVAPSGVVAAHGSVWVTNAADGTVSRIDPSRDAEVERIPVGSGPSGISAGRDIWVANSASNTVSKIDGRRHTFVEEINVGADPRGIAVVGGTVWVSYNAGSVLARIAADDTAVADLVPVGRQPDQIAAVDGHVWTTLQGTGAIAEVDPSTGSTVRTVPLGPVPGGLTAAGGKLWVTTGSDPALHRGGTLRLAGSVDVIDPVFLDSLNSISLLAGSYDGLLAFRHSSGADGLTIVPDLAIAIPKPTDSGRTYTFHLRPGIRWSTGRPVTGADVRRGIERVAAAPFFPPLRSLLVGGSRCRPTRCDIAGITVDEAARTVTIKLVRTSGNLLDLLANGTYAMPSATPIPQVRRPIPATGPYQVAEYVRGKKITFTRNPYFREWSAAAQPDGAPDRIEYQIVPNLKAARTIDRVAAGELDWTDALEDSTGVDTGFVDKLRIRFGSRARLTPTQIMYGLFLNTRIPPFDDPRVRRALAYAIDRRAVAQDWAEPATVTCQFVPADYPGYRPYCPYTSRPGDGSWQGPDLATALHLVEGLHPERTLVTVWATPYTRNSIQHIVEALRDLHFRVRFRVWPNRSFDYFGYVLNTSHHVQAAFMGWLTYDASATNLFGVYRCDAFVQSSDNNLNPAGYCDPSVDRLMTRAEGAQATSLASANDLWAQVERRLVDAAPWIPLVNPFSVDLLSTHVHNFKRSPTLGVLFDQMWVR